ncbi:MAG: hypothetical protein AABW73_05145 [Nanoarchaeota archaeon]
MILNRLKNGSAYERLAYLQSQIVAELEPVFFSVVYPMTQISSRIGGISNDPDTEMWKYLIIGGFTASAGIAGATAYYLASRKVKTPVDFTNHALDATFEGVDRAGRIVNETARAIRRSVDDISERV